MISSVMLVLFLGPLAHAPLAAGDPRPLLKTLERQTWLLAARTVGGGVAGAQTGEEGAAAYGAALFAAIGAATGAVIGGIIEAVRD